MAQNDASSEGPSGPQQRGRGVRERATSIFGSEFRALNFEEAARTQSHFLSSQFFLDLTAHRRLEAGQMPRPRWRVMNKGSSTERGRHLAVLRDYPPYEASAVYVHSFASVQQGTEFYVTCHAAGLSQISRNSCLH